MLSFSAGCWCHERHKERQSVTNKRSILQDNLRSVGPQSSSQYPEQYIPHSNPPTLPSTSLHKVETGLFRDASRPSCHAPLSNLALPASDIRNWAEQGTGPSQSQATPSLDDWIMISPQGRPLPRINTELDNPNIQTHVALTGGGCHPDSFQVLAGVTCVVSPFLSSDMFLDQLGSHGATVFQLPPNFTTPYPIPRRGELLFVVPWTKKVGYPPGSVTHREHFRDFFVQHGGLTLTTVEIDLWISELTHLRRQPELEWFLPEQLRAFQRPPDIFCEPHPPSIWRFTQPLQHPIPPIPPQFRITLLAKNTPITQAVRYYFAEAMAHGCRLPNAHLIRRSAGPAVFTESPNTIPVVVLGLATRTPSGEPLCLTPSLDSNFWWSYWCTADTNDLEGRTPRSYLEVVATRAEMAQNHGGLGPYIVTLDWAIQIMISGVFLDPSSFALTRTQLEGFGYQAPAPDDLDYSYVYAPWPDILEKSRASWPLCGVAGWDHEPISPRLQSFAPSAAISQNLTLLGQLDQDGTELDPSAADGSFATNYEAEPGIGLGIFLPDKQEGTASRNRPRTPPRQT